MESDASRVVNPTLATHGGAVNRGVACTGHETRPLRSVFSGFSVTDKAVTQWAQGEPGEHSDVVEIAGMLNLST